MKKQKKVIEGYATDIWKHYFNWTTDSLFSILGERVLHLPHITQKQTGKRIKVKVTIEEV